jgi:hypothetical protein
MFMPMHALRQFVSGVLVFALGVPVLAAAQTPTLGELARREQERRKAVKSPGKVITNKDLPASAQQPAPTPTETTSAGVPVEADKKAAEQADTPKSDARDEAWWKKRITEAREALRRNEAFIEALQSRVNALSTDFVSRDDPYQRAKIGEDRQKALIEMERVKAEIALGKKNIEDIEEEARKAGVPPGWLR